MNTTFSPLRQKLLWGVLIAILIGNGVTVILTAHPSLRGLPPKGAGRSNDRKVPEGSRLAVYGEAPDFSLTERSSEPFSKSELLGKPWIADFIFTRCSGQCPLMSAEMRRLQDFFPKESGLRLVSFTVDPKWDTPPVLSEYANRFSAEKDRWFFLTGPKEEINRVLRGFFLSGVDAPNMHSTRFVLVDPKGRIRGYYDASDPASLKQLIDEAKLLLRRE